MAGGDETGDGDPSEPVKGDESRRSPKEKTEGEREQIKLEAAYLNGIAVGLFLIGGLSIPSAILLNSGSGWLATGVAALCFPVSFILHKGAKRSLRELDR